MKSVKDVKVDETGSSSDQSTDAGVARPQARIEIGEIALGLNHKALPSSLIEKKRYIICYGVAGSNVDIGPSRLALEGQRQMIVFHVLGV
jgi:hypothetical protein